MMSAERHVLFLNGTPASGKTTVARAFQRQRLADAGELWLLVQLDTFTEMPPVAVDLSEGQLASCIDSMYAALSAVMSAPLDLVVELVVRDDDSVRQIVGTLRDIASHADRTESWVTLSASERVRRERALARRTAPVDISTRLDPAYVGFGVLIDTDELDPAGAAARIGSAMTTPGP